MTTTIAVLTTDGRRDCVDQTVESIRDNLKGDLARRILFTDSDNAGYVRWLQGRFPDWRISLTGPRRGYGAAMNKAWAQLLRCTDGPVFWTEDDFTFNRTVDVDEMAGVLASNQRYAQLALRRQPWNPDEEAAGGVVEAHPGAFAEELLWDNTAADPRLHAVLSQSGWWTNNPSLVSPWVLFTAYPEGKGAEGEFTFRLKQSRGDVLFGYWGAMDSGEAVRHIGEIGVRGSR